MKLASTLAAAISLFAAAPSLAQEVAPAAPRAAPKLVVVISVDQFSADLFAEYRARYTQGFARLLSGAGSR